MLLLYCTPDKNKKDTIQEEVKKHQNNAKVIAKVLMCLVTSNKPCKRVASD